MRDVIRHCIYGVDINPLATDLCRVALWLEGHHRSMPLAFLDHRIKTGNSLAGVDTIERLKQGIPDEAFKPVTGDDKEAARKIKEQNRLESAKLKTGQMLLTPEATGRLDANLQTFADELETLRKLDEQVVDDVQGKQKLYSRLHSGEAWMRDWTACHIWTAAFYRPLLDPDDPATPTQGKLMQYMNNPAAADGRLVGQATALSYRYRFFHWPLEFPEIARAGGFDVVLSNPPWEQLQPEEIAFFQLRDQTIARMAGSRRKAAIERLRSANPQLFSLWMQYKGDFELINRFVRGSGRFLLTSYGKLNTYALFSELARNLSNNQGRAGLIVPTGIATDEGCKDFFAELNSDRQLVSLYDFENREALFQGVHRSYKFSLLTLAADGAIKDSDFASFLTNTSHLDGGVRHFRLSADDIAVINPNTRTMPLFRTGVDAALTKRIYERIPILVNEATGVNSWGAEFRQGLFNMTTDHQLFSSEPLADYVPLYEAKMLWQYDHRSGTYEGMELDTNSVQLETPTHHAHSDPSYSVRPRYWVARSEVVKRLLSDYPTNWLIGFRAIARSTDMRSLICTILPPVGCGHSIVLAFCREDSAHRAAFAGSLNSIVSDFVVRQKLAGVNVQFMMLRQLPVLAPTSYSDTDLRFVLVRILELTYTAHDLKPFAEDMGFAGPPFRWDEDRRALVKAELDAYYARLYGLTREELRYILDPQDVYGPDFPGETFRVLKEKEMKQYGEYRTRRLVLDAWDRLEQGELR